MGPAGRGGGGERRRWSTGEVEGGGGEETEAGGQAPPGGGGQEGDQETQVSGTEIGGGAGGEGGDEGEGEGEQGNQREAGGGTEGGGEWESSAEQGVEDEEGDRCLEEGRRRRGGSNPGGGIGRWAGVYKLPGWPLEWTNPPVHRWSPGLLSLQTCRLQNVSDSSTREKQGTWKAQDDIGQDVMNHAVAGSQVMTKCPYSKKEQDLQSLAW